MSIVLHKYGWHGFSALRGMIAYERYERTNKDYTAICSGLLAQLLAKFCGAELSLPHYMELAYPDRVKPAAEDTRSGTEIVADLIKHLERKE